MTRGAGDKRTACRARVVQRLSKLRQGLLSSVAERDVRHHRRGRQQAGVVEDGTLAGNRGDRWEWRAGIVGRAALPANKHTHTGRRAEQQGPACQSAGTPCTGMLFSQRERGENTTSATASAFRKLRSPCKAIQPAGTSTRRSVGAILISVR